MNLNNYNPDLCERCGKCLSACPRVDLSPDQAAIEIGLIAKGLPGSKVLGKCVSCFACNLACPNGLDPHGLIARAWSKKRTEQTMPLRVSVSLPHQQRPNVWTGIQKGFSKPERELFSSLDRDVSSEEIIYLGCNQLLNPYVALTPLFADTPIAAAPGVCCGEPYFRMGFLDLFERSAKGWLDHWEERAPSRMIVFCTACLNMFKNIYPAYLGRSPSFEIISVFEWLDEKIESGEIKISKPVEAKALIQDSCHSKILGREYRDLCRKLVKAAGVSIVEPDEGPGGSDCCGFAAAAAGFSPWPMYSMSTGRLRLAKQLGADYIATYCNGCALMLSMAKRLYPSPVRILPLIEALSTAAGHDVNSDYRRRAGQIIGATLAVAATKFIRPSDIKLSFPTGH